MHFWFDGTVTNYGPRPVAWLLVGIQNRDRGYVRADLCERSVSRWRVDHGRTASSQFAGAHRSSSSRRPQWQKALEMAGFILFLAVMLTIGLPQYALLTRSEL